MFLSWDFCLNSFPNKSHLSQVVMERKYFYRGSERSVARCHWSASQGDCSKESLELRKVGFTEHPDSCFYLQWLSLGESPTYFIPHQYSLPRALGCLQMCSFALSFNVQREFQYNFCKVLMWQSPLWLLGTGGFFRAVNKLLGEFPHLLFIISELTCISSPEVRLYTLVL